MNPAVINPELVNQVVRNLPNNALTPVRIAAAENFSNLRFPSTRDEHWKYTSLASVAALGNDWLESQVDALTPAPRTAGAEPALPDLCQAIEANWLVVRDGVVDDAAFQEFVKTLGPQISVSRLRDDVGRKPLRMDDALSSLNAALLRDGLRLTVSADYAPDRPIGLLFMDNDDDSLTQNRVLIDCESNARLQVLICSQSGGTRQFSNRVTDATLAKGAVLDLVQLQVDSKSQSSVNSITAQLAAESRFHHFACDFGSELARNNVDVNLQGSGAHAELNGIYLASGSQHIDNHLYVRHEVGPAVSKQNYRGMQSGRSRCVFNGKVEVLKGADGTDAHQTNHNLLLSDTAEIDTKPELEIYADDVKCSHGATVGQLNEDEIFYLRSRGLDLAEAKQLLIRAFAAEPLSLLPVASCRDYVSEQMEKRLRQLIDEGSA